LPSPGLAQTSLVRLQPNPITIEVGNTAQLVVEIVDVVDLYGFDFLINFDPDVLEVIDAYSKQDGIQVNLGTFLDSGLEIRNFVDNKAGTVRFAMTELNPSLPKSGSGVLAVITLKGKKISSNSALTFEKVQLAHRDVTEIQANVENGNAKVVWNATEATNTLVPTQAGGTPIDSIIQTVTAMPSSTPTQEVIQTHIPTNPKKVKNSSTPTSIHTQASSASGETYPTSTNTQSGLASATSKSESEETIQASNHTPASKTEVQSVQKTKVTSTFRVETIALDDSNQNAVLDTKEDNNHNAGLSLLFVGIGIGLISGIAGFGLLSIFKKR